MDKNTWMYVAIAAAVFALYQMNEKKTILKKIKGVAGLPADVAQQANAA